MQNNMMQQFQQFMQNPLQTLLSKGMNIPQSIAGNPNEIVQHLLNTGQISQEQYNQASQMARQFHLH